MHTPEMFHALSNFRMIMADVVELDRRDKKLLKVRLKEGADYALSVVRKDPETIIHKARQLRSQNLLDEARPSRVKQCTNVVLEHGWDTLESLRSRLAGKDPNTIDFVEAGMSIAQFDFLIGQMVVAGSVTLAETEIGKGADKAASAAVAAYGQLFGRELTLTTGANIYMHVSGDAQTYAKYLRKDPTGIRLIEEAAARYNNQREIPKLIPAYMEPMFVGVGANFGADFYKTIYPLSERF